MAEERRTSVLTGAGMIKLLLVAVALVPSGSGDFKADFPAASVIESPAGGRLMNASSFEAAGLGDTPEAAAREFLARYGMAFGVTAREELVVRTAPSPGQPGPVRFERRVGGFPLFDGDMVVGVAGRNTVILVNGTDVPAPIKGRARISRQAAIHAAKAAIPGLEMMDAPRTERGWRAAGKVIRPAWRVDFTAARPPGDWRTYVDAETGTVLFRMDLRAAHSAPGIIPGRGGLEGLMPKR
jgi:Zn-dependent metalloprotease